MKLINCPECDDVVALKNWKKSCKCGLVYGKYIDSLRVKVSSKAVPLVFDTNKVTYATNLQHALQVIKELSYDVDVYPSPDNCDFKFEDFDE